MILPNSVFVDTSFFIALLNSDDADHARAIELQVQLTEAGSHKVTSEYVLMELGDGLSHLRFRHLAIKLIELVHADSSFDHRFKIDTMYFAIHTNRCRARAAVL